MGAVVNTLFGTRQENASGAEGREETEERNGSSTGDTQADRTPFQSYMSTHWITVIYFGARACIVLLGITYVLQSLVQDYYYSPTTYYLIFLIACIVNLSRFYTRYSNTNIPFFSREFLQYSMLEKSFLSFAYAFMFLKSYPTLPLVIPILLTALINMALFTKQVVQLLSPQMRPTVTKFTQLITSHQHQLMRISGISEICSFPITLLHMTSGHASIFQPFLCFTYLKLRVASGSNPYILHNLQGLEMMFISLSNHQYCPALLSRLIHGSLYYIGKICSIQQVPVQGAR